MKRQLIYLLPLVVAAFTFFLGITWGLPSRDTDRFLFGDRTPWTGKEILALTGGWGNADRATDHDANPLANRDQPIIVNATDPQRAEIVQRFRLYTHQPDEMITLRALSQMRPGEIRSNLWALDPKMYQYGGLWVYPVGAMLKLGSILGVIEVKVDVAYYLDHPDAFGRFYFVMRAYSATWGLLGVVAVMLIVHRMTRCRLATLVGGVAFATLPVVVNMAHEAKPHLAGVVLLLWTVLLATTYVERGSWKWAAITGAAWGAATGMVLLSLPGGIVLPLMVLLRPQPWAVRLRDATLAIGLGLLVYALTNPYVVLNTLRPSGALSANVQNYGNFYSVSDVLAGLQTGLDLIPEGTSLPIAVVGLLVTIVALLRRCRTDILVSLSPRPYSVNDRGETGGETGRNAFPTSETVSWLLAVPAAVVALQFVLLGAHKPGEYGRFALLPDIALMIACVVWAAGIRATTPARLWVRRIAFLSIVGVTMVAGGRYLLNFVVGERNGSRQVAAASIAGLNTSTGSRLGIVAEPAPYCMPPVDLFRWQLVLLPRGQAVPELGTMDLFVATVDVPTDAPEGFRHLVRGPRWADLWPSRISWANKPIDLFIADTAEINP